MNSFLEREKNSNIVICDEILENKVLDLGRSL